MLDDTMAKQHMSTNIIDHRHNLYFYSNLDKITTCSYLTGFNWCSMTGNRVGRWRSKALASTATNGPMVIAANFLISRCNTHAKKCIYRVYIRILVMIKNE